MRAWESSDVLFPLWPCQINIYIKCNYHGATQQIIECNYLYNSMNVMQPLTIVNVFRGDTDSRPAALNNARPTQSKGGACA